MKKMTYFLKISVVYIAAIPLVSHALSQSVMRPVFGLSDIESNTVTLILFFVLSIYTLILNDYAHVTMNPDQTQGDQLANK